MFVEGLLIQYVHKAIFYDNSKRSFNPRAVTERKCFFNEISV